MRLKIILFQVTFTLTGTAARDPFHSVEDTFQKQNLRAKNSELMMIMQNQ